jgi:FkbM family methyltransferase
MANQGRRLRTAFNRRVFKGLVALRGAKATRIVDVYGYAVRLSLDEQIQMEIALGNYEREESEWVEEILKPGMVVLDVGANIGYYSLLAASRVGTDGKVVAFEPSPYCQTRLAETVRENSITQLAIAPFALGDEPGNLELVVEHMGLHSPSFLATEGDLKYLVPVVTLDSFVESSGIHEIDLVKIDVEGFEPNVIRGAAGCLHRRMVAFILCELNEVWLARNSSSCAHLDGLIRSFGFAPVKTAKYAYHSNILYATERRPSTIGRSRLPGPPI